jgi:hypothetical protein
MGWLVRPALAVYPPESECRQRVERSIRARRSVRRAGWAGRAPGCGPASWKSRSVRPPSSWLDRARVTVFQRMSMSGWWPAASAAEATSLTNTIAWAKSSRTKVLAIWLPRRSQPGRRCRPSATAVSSSRGMAPPSRRRRLSVIAAIVRTTDRPPACRAAGRRRSDTIGRCRTLASACQRHDR